MSEVFTANLDEFRYDKGAKQLDIYSEAFAGCFPDKIIVRSPYTGKNVTFTPIKPDHIRYDQDGWDGEMAIYEPQEFIPNVRILVISHAF